MLDHLQKPAEDLFVAMKEAVIIANEKIYSEKIVSEQNNQMACVLTLAVADIRYNQFYYAHVGDTRLYLLRDHTLIKITRDDSFVGFLEDSKRLSEEEAMNHPKRNEVSKALGFDPNIGAISDYIEIGISPFLPGDTLLLCSDGLTDMIDSKAITSILTSSQKVSPKAKALMNAANDAGGQDNITVVLVQNNKKSVAHKATKPPVVKKNEIHEDSDNDEQENVTRLRNDVKTTNSRASVIALSILSAALLGCLLWQVLKNKGERPVIPVIIKQDSNPAQQKFQHSIQQSSLLILNNADYGKSIPISDTIFIKKDSLHINGNGMVLKSDPLYKGTGLVIHADCKYIVLENIEFENFEKAIVAANSRIYLRNIRFTHCNIPLEYQLTFPENKFITGNITDTSIFKTDTIYK